MMFRKTHERDRYDFRDARCIAAKCWQPGSYQHRGATGGGSRDTGSYSLCCMRREYHGCPSEVVYLVDLGRQRRAEGWKPCR